MADAITKPPPPLRRISHISMAAVVLEPLTEEEAEQITLFMFAGSLEGEGEVTVRTGEGALPNNWERGTFWTGEGDLIFFRETKERDNRSPIELAMLLADPFQSEETFPTVVSEENQSLGNLELAFAEHHGTLESEPCAK